MQDDDGSGRSQAAQRKTRRALFIACALMLQVAVLGGLELGLRAVGYGGDRPLFIDAEGRAGYRHAGPDVMWRYYPGTPEPVAVIEPILFRAQKPDGGLRLVVQGGSTAAGFPYGRWAGLAGMLGDRLEAALPGREVEVITTAMAAVNSYTLLDLADEIIEIEPDAVLIYAGHNEYLGVLGAASALGGGAGRALTRLRIETGSLRLYQLVASTIGLASAVLRDPARGAGRSLFARAAAGSQVEPGSELDARGVAQLERNLGALLARYREAGIPVYLATLVSNERDQPPFAGGPRPGIDAGVWRTGWSDYARHLEQGDAVAARHDLAGLMALDTRSADVHYALGQLEDREGRRDDARLAYGRARDLDRLRFRAPDAIGERIRELARLPGVTLVDVEARFREAVDDGILDERLLLEHVHPNDAGYFLLADAFYDALAKDGWLDGASPRAEEARARRDRPITRVDRILVAYDVAELRSGFPFRDPPAPYRLPPPRDEVEVIAQQLRRKEIPWLVAMDSLLQIHRREGDLHAAAVVARMAAQADPFDSGANLAAGLLLLQLGEPDRALRYLERSVQESPDDRRARRALARAQRRLAPALRR